MTSDIGAPLAGVGPWQWWHAFASALDTAHGTIVPPLVLGLIAGATWQRLNAVEAA